MRAIPHTGGGGRNSSPAQIVYSGAGVAVPQTFLASTFSSPRVLFGTAGTTTVSSVSAANDTLTIPSNNGRLDAAEQAVVTSTGNVPAPLVSGQRYYIVNVSGGVTFGLSATQGGTPIDLTDAGSGTISVALYQTDLGARPMVSRGLDSGMPTWAACNPSSGTYDWTFMDEYMDYHYKQRGRQTLFCFNQTPTWAARNAALDAYGYAGGGQVPTSLSSGATFITALLSRYNAVSAFNPAGAKMFIGVEAWNEPQFAATGTTSTNWCGTMAELSQFTRLVNVAAKAVDASILILAPGFTSGHAVAPPSLTTNSMYGWMLASDGAGGAGKDWVDGACWHGYDTSDVMLPLLAGKIATYRAYLVAAGLSPTFPVYMTERGVSSPNNPLHAVRCAAVEAALGMAMSVQYRWDSFGIYPRGNAALLAAMNQFYDAACGKTLTYCAINQDGSVTVTANGTSYTW